MAESESFIGGRCDFCGIVLRLSKHKAEADAWICSNCFYEDLYKPSVDWDLYRKDRDLEE